MFRLEISWGKRCDRHIRISASWQAAAGSTGGTRAWLTCSYSNRFNDWSFLLQMYRPTACLGKHVDSGNRVETLALELWRGKEGRLVVHDDEARSWLRGRVQRFNACRVHEVTRCSSHRVSLLFQRMYLQPKYD